MSKPFKLNSAFRPSGDQPEAIRRLEEGLEDGLAHQTLLGVTGSGKTFTIANVIADLSVLRWFSRRTKRWRRSCMVR